MTTVSLPATRQTKAFTAMRGALDSLTFHIGNVDDLQTLAEGLNRLREHRRATADLERDLERRVADLMDADQVNLDDNVTLERRRGSKRTKWQSAGLLSALCRRAGVDSNGALVSDQERFDAFYTAVQSCVPLTASLPWRTGALREWGLDADEYCSSEPGRVSVSVKVATDG